MQFVITAHDGKNVLEQRMAVRPEHLANMARLGSHVLCAGGILDGDGKPAGSVLVVDFDSRDRLEEYLASEPYIREKVWQDVTAEPMNVVILGGEKVGQ